MSDSLIYVPDGSFSPNCPFPNGAFAGVPQATLQTYLANAQAALAALISGSKPVTVAYGEGSGQKSVTYARTNETMLRNHIRELQQALGNRGARRRAIGVAF